MLQARARAWLERILDAGRAAWPGFEVNPEDLLRRLVAAEQASEARVTGVGGSSSADVEGEKSTEEAHAGDLFLALACAAGHSLALAEFDRCLLRPAAAHATR